MTLPSCCNSKHSNARVVEEVVVIKHLGDEGRAAGGKEQ